MDKTKYFDSFFGNYFTDLNSKNDILLDKDGVFISRSPYQQKNKMMRKKEYENEYKNEYENEYENEIVDAQLENSKKTYNSIYLQFILFLISTLILIFFVFVINSSGNLSIFVVILLLIILFLIFKYLRFNIITFISNFKF